MPPYTSTSAVSWQPRRCQLLLDCFTDCFFKETNSSYGWNNFSIIFTFINNFQLQTVSHCINVHVKLKVKYSKTAWNEMCHTWDIHSSGIRLVHHFEVAQWSHLQQLKHPIFLLGHHQLTWHHIPDEWILHWHNSENIETHTGLPVGSNMLFSDSLGSFSIRNTNILRTSVSLEYRNVW